MIDFHPMSILVTGTKLEMNVKINILIVLSLALTINLGCENMDLESMADLESEIDNIKDDGDNGFPGDNEEDHLDEILPMENAFNNAVLKVLPLSNDHLLVGGIFTGHSKSDKVEHIAVIGSDGRINKNFSFRVNGSVTTLHKLKDNSILVGGDFNNFNNESIGSLIKLNADGSVNTKFSKNIGSGFDGPVLSISSFKNQLLIAGDFTRLNGNDCIRFIRLSHDGLPIDLEQEFKNENESQPAPEEPQPILAEEQPEVETQEPVIAEEKPDVEAQEPVIAEEKPEVEEQEPVVADEKPEVEGTLDRDIASDREDKKHKKDREDKEDKKHKKDREDKEDKKHKEDREDREDKKHKEDREDREDKKHKEDREDKEDKKHKRGKKR